MTNKNWIRMVQENYRHYSDINMGQNVYNTKFWTQYGKKIWDYSRSRNVFWTDLREQDEGLFMMIYAGTKSQTNILERRCSRVYNAVAV